jgi:hypothetical protein
MVLNWLLLAPVDEAAGRRRGAGSLEQGVCESPPGPAPGAGRLEKRRTGGKRPGVCRGVATWSDRRDLRREGSAGEGAAGICAAAGPLLPRARAESRLAMTQRGKERGKEESLGVLAVGCMDGHSIQSGSGGQQLVGFNWNSIGDRIGVGGAVEDR